MEQVYPLKDDQFYTIPEDDANRLLRFFQELHSVGLDDGWYSWMVGFMGAPVSIGAIDDLAIGCAVSAERERCSKIAENLGGHEIAWHIRRGESDA